MATGNNGVLLGKALFFGLILILVFCAIAASACGCAGRQQQVATNTPATAADVEALEARLSATPPRPDGPDAWNRGLGLVVGVVALDLNTGRMVDIGITLFADFGDNTNVTMSDELSANLRLVAELTTRVPDLQGIAIISFAGSDLDGVNLRRAVAISQALVTYGVNESAIVYRVARTEQAENQHPDDDTP